MRLKSVNIQGYRPFRNFEAQLEPLEIIVGANGSGKSSLFEFLKFLRDSLYQYIPPEIISGSMIKVYTLGHYLFWLLYLKKPLNALKFY